MRTVALPVPVAGTATIEEGNGFALDPVVVPGRYGQMMVDHLFGTVCTDDTLDPRDRRLLATGARAALDKPDVVEVQFDAALRRPAPSEPGRDGTR